MREPSKTITFQDIDDNKVTFFLKYLEMRHFGDKWVVTNLLKNKQHNVTKSEYLRILAFLTRTKRETK